MNHRFSLTIKQGVIAATLLVLGLGFSVAHAQGVPLINVTNAPGGSQYSLTLQLLALMTALTLLPSLLLMMTSFVRVIIVMSLLRQALGTGQTPPNLVLVGLALFLTLFIMQPVFTDVYTNALLPYFDGRLPFDQALALAEKPFRAFMLNQTREDDIAMFMEIARNTQFNSPQDIPFSTLVPAFITSELKSAFTIAWISCVIGWFMNSVMNSFFILLNS